MQWQGHVGWVERAGRCVMGVVWDAQRSKQVSTSLTPRGPNGPSNDRTSLTPHPPHPTQNPHHPTLAPRPVAPAPYTLTTAAKGLSEGPPKPTRASRAAATEGPQNTSGPTVPNRARVPRARASGGESRARQRDLFGNMDQEVNELDRVAPLIIIPSHELDERRAQLNASLGVED